MGNPAAGDNSYNDEQIREDDGDHGDGSDADNDETERTEQKNV